MNNGELYEHLSRPVPHGLQQEVEGSCCAQGEAFLLGKQHGRQEWATGNGPSAPATLLLLPHFGIFQATGRSPNWAYFTTHTSATVTITIKVASCHHQTLNAFCSGPVKGVCLLRCWVQGGSLLLTCTPSHEAWTYLLQSLA